HVESPAAPEVAVDDVAAERLAAPLLVEGRDHVDVTLEQQRRSVAATLDTRHQVGPPGRVLVPRAFDVRVLQHSFDEVDGGVLIAGWVGRVEPDEVASHLDDERKRRHVYEAS